MPIDLNKLSSLSRHETVLELLKARKQATGLRFGAKRLGAGPPDYQERANALLSAAQAELRALYPKTAFALGFNFSNPCVIPEQICDPAHPDLAYAISNTNLLFGIFISSFYPYYPVLSRAYVASLFKKALGDCALLPKTRALFEMLLQLSQPFVSIVSGNPQTKANGATFDDFVISVEYAPGQPFNYAPVVFSWEADSGTPGAAISLANPYSNQTGPNGILAVSGVQATAPGIVYLTASSGNASPPVVFTLTIT